LLVHRVLQIGSNHQKKKSTVLQLQLNNGELCHKLRYSALIYLNFLAVASNITTNIDNSITSAVRDAPIQHIDIQPRSNKADSNQISSALFSKVENRNINVYNNCNFTK
jgi:hypothetical protein